MEPDLLEHSDRPVTSDDVASVYQMFLGRRPENEAVVAEKLALSLEQLVGEIVSSNEFRLYVLKPLMGGGAEDKRFNAPSPPGLRAWAATVLGMELNDLHLATSWGLLLLEVLAFAQKSERFPGLTLIDAERLGIDRALNLRRRAMAHATLEGALEIFDEEVIEGWALDTADPDRLLVVHLLIDGMVIAAASPDLFRRDLQDVHGGAGQFGFRIMLPPFAVSEAQTARTVRVDLVEQASQHRLDSRTWTRDPQPRLDAMSHVTALLEEVRDRLVRVEAQLPRARAETSFSVRSYDAYRRAYCVRFPVELARQHEQASDWTSQPYFWVICANEADKAGRDQTQATLQRQSYAFWSWGRDDQTPGEGDYFVFLASGEELEPDALFRLAELIRENGPLVLTVDDDELQVDELGRRSFCAPRLMGRHDPWLSLQREQKDALFVVKASFARTVSFAPGRLDAIKRFQLTTAAGPSRVSHLPHVLHHRRRMIGTLNAPPEGLLEAVRREVLRTGVAATVTSHDDVLGASLPDALQIRPDGAQARMASVIIPTRDRLDLIRPCIEGLLATRSANATPFELLVVDNGGEDEDTARYLADLSQRGEVRCISDSSAFNWSRLNNRAAEQVSGDVLIFLNDDTTPVSPAWCDELCLWASWPGVGVAGARLIYGDGTIQHAGVVTGVFGEAAHEGVGKPGHDPGYLGRHALVRRVNAVTGACIAVRRACFDALGGFDEIFPVAYNDIEFCLRAQSHGWAVLYAPQAVFHHFESKTRRFDAQLDEPARVQRRQAAERLHASWGVHLTQDPFYNPHFERWAPPFSRLAAPPA